MTAILAAGGFVVALYSFAAWLLMRGERPRRRRWAHGRRP